MHFDIKALVSGVGYLGLFSIVFAESGLFFGFFLPGDSLLVTAGLLASQGLFRIEVLLLLLTFAAISGDSVGYWFGKKLGPRIFKRENSRIFNKKHLETASNFYKEHGSKTIIIARFLPYIRTFAPIAAGIGNMHYQTFLLFNIVGGILWSCGMLLIGYFLGNLIPDVDKYLIPLIGLIIFLSFLPSLIEHRKYIKRQIVFQLRKLNRLK